MGAKRAFGGVDLGIEKEDTYLHSQKKQDIYGTEELNFKVIFRLFTMPVSQSKYECNQKVIARYFTLFENTLDTLYL